MSSSLTDKEYENLKISVCKAFMSDESPVKQKHIRAILIGTFKNKGAHTFWTIIYKQPINDNRISSWKFCNVLHQILREGHHLCLQDSMHHLERIINVGILGACFHGGYGLCIQQYTKLLVVKLNFHNRNPRFPGNLVLTREELNQITVNDINIFYQLAIEMFDYLDEILTLQTMVFYTTNQLRLSTDSTAGQCRLRPLVSCVQDSIQLYDHCMHVMFYLHEKVSSDLLTGHRERFEIIFRQLKHFYMQIYDISYFEDLRSVLLLPAYLPNFVSFIEWN
ncbi:unnamed protein product [Diamesa hyperborea]